ncbi:hypothetical protein [Flavobacterium sp.]|uniref:hypothetical protein n=1 Tax=Flavobacterium sp. TaxID=239 RepID=UPI0025EB3772|nr:hypothetical protein [Flavobacterium sp.]
MVKQFRPSPNAFKNTFCVFNELPIAAIEGLSVQYESKAGSSYYYTKEGMYRLSNHWGRLANSKWRLEPMEIESPTKHKLGFALWTSFYPDNATDKLYYLEANFEKKTVNYQHKNNPTYNQKAVIRTSFETAKRIKQIRNLFELTSWAKYFEYDDLDDLRMKIINGLIHTEKSLEEIKREQL